MCACKSREVLDAKAKLLAKWREVDDVGDAITASARAKVKEEAIEDLVHRRIGLENEGHDLLLDYYCAAERAAGRDPYQHQREVPQ